MADFKTHITASSFLGVAYGGAAYAMYDVPAPTCLLAAGLCGVSGMLPDIDSGPGRPLREITLFLAAVVPTMLFDRFQRVGMSAESIILVGAAVYVAIRFGLAEFLKHFTVHRGMFHSLPAAVIFGELAFLLASGDDTLLRWYKAGAVVLGYVSHLVLDEIYSVQWNGLPRAKKSFGTALKIVGHGWWPNLSTYGKLAVLTLVVIEEPGLMRNLHQGEMEQVIENIAREIPDRLPASIHLPAAMKAPAARPAPQADPKGADGAAADRSGQGAPPGPQPGQPVVEYTGRERPLYRTARPNSPPGAPISR